MITTPMPIGPGLPEHAPSVQISSAAPRSLVPPTPFARAGVSEARVVDADGEEGVRAGRGGAGGGSVPSSGKRLLADGR